jgi:hypothetical protein
MERTGLLSFCEWWLKTTWARPYSLWITSPSVAATHHGVGSLDDDARPDADAPRAVPKTDRPRCPPHSTSLMGAVSTVGLVLVVGAEKGRAIGLGSTWRMSCICVDCQGRRRSGRLVGAMCGVSCHDEGPGRRGLFPHRPRQLRRRQPSARSPRCPVRPLRGAYSSRLKRTA